MDRFAGPGARGGLLAVGVALLALALLIGGALVARAWGPGSQPGSDANIGLAENGSPDESGSNDATAAPGSASDATALRSQAGSETASAPQIAADLRAVAQPPIASGADTAPTEDPAGGIQDSWGEGLLPQTLGSLTRLGPAEVSPASVSAVYAGQAGSAVDIANVTITDARNGGAATALIAASLEQYPDTRLAFSLEGRAIEQGLTREDHPERYPAALYLGWPVGQYAVEWQIVPVLPAAVNEARTQAVDGLRALDY